jgi:antitoxin component of MazEF toxin-antitoxin module
MTKAIIKIGNSKGIRLAKMILEKYHIQDSVELDLEADHIVLRPVKTIVIAPITSQSRNYPSRVEFNFEGTRNWIILDQIRTVDKNRVLEIIDYLPRNSR